MDRAYDTGRDPLNAALDRLRSVVLTGDTTKVALLAAALEVPQGFRPGRWGPGVNRVSGASRPGKATASWRPCGGLPRGRPLVAPLGLSRAPAAPPAPCDGRGEVMTPFYAEDGITLYCGDCRDVDLPTHRSTLSLPTRRMVNRSPTYEGSVRKL